MLDSETIGMSLGVAESVFIMMTVIGVSAVIAFIIEYASERLNK